MFIVGNVKDLRARIRGRRTVLPVYDPRGHEVPGMHRRVLAYARVSHVTVQDLGRACFETKLLIWVEHRSDGYFGPMAIIHAGEPERP